MHGFKFGNEMYFIAVANWDNDNHCIRELNQDMFYTIKSSDKGKFYDSFRMLYNSWLKAAEADTTLVKDNFRKI